jgi:REP element-mobilizing transposase RayT
MPRNRKLLIHGKVYEICFRTEEGLPFAPTPYIKAIWESILARAQSLYRVRIVAGILMSNHPHLLIRVEDPEDVPKFVAYVKKETAHALNRLLGVEQHTVWQRCSVPDCIFS